MLGPMPPTVHEQRLRVRYGETDTMGVVYHANYLVYMEEGRAGLMRELGVPYSELERTGTYLAVRKAELRFRAPARYDEELRVRTRIERLRSASVAFAYTIERAADGQLLAEGSTELACLRGQDGERRPAHLPDELRALLERAMR
jgi:acyl-CoA thioester hydrolase